MELELTPDQSLFVETTRRYLENRAPIAHVRMLHDKGGSFDPAYWRGGAELGWTSLLVPEQLGGGSIGDHGLLDLVLVAEEFGRGVAPGPLLSTNVVAEALCRATNAQQHAAAIAQLVSGDATAAWAFHEGSTAHGPVAVADAIAVADAVTARADGDGCVVDGTKTFVLDATTAQHLLLTVRDGDGDGDGLSQFLVPATRAGVTVVPRRSLDLVRPVGDVHLAAVRLTPADLVGAPGQAGDEVAHQLLTALVLQNAETVGAMQRVLEFTLEYARDRIAFGRSIGSYQALKHRFADMKMWTEACLATSQASARAVATGAGDAAEMVTIAKSYIADKVPSMVQDCVQLHGGIGVTWEHDLHLYLRRVTQNAFLFGGVQHHREQLAAHSGM
ncbi:MAG: acyl-CoA dehydrogenase family protein [Actinomycetota bacterium]|nr:acyl-CoA dehydrogenase family protein [Actinomycetota bacterium]